MISESTVEQLTTWFVSHADTFSSTDPDLQFNLTLKKEHTFRVVDEITAIGSALGLPASDLAIARVAALMHDVGRFEQYVRYKTFADRDSADHAQLALDLIRKEGVLSSLDVADRDLILCAIEHHNRAVVPEQLSDRQRLFCNLLRDADKLDIMRILVERYRTAATGAKSAVELLLPQGEGISPEALGDLMAGTIVKFSHARTGNDFKLLQMAWVFDINFVPSLRLFQERGYLESFRNALPDTVEVREAYLFVKGEMEKRVGVPGS